MSAMCQERRKTINIVPAASIQPPLTPSTSHAMEGVSARGDSTSGVDSFDSGCEEKTTRQQGLLKLSKTRGGVIVFPSERKMMMSDSFFLLGIVIPTM